MPEATFRHGDPVMVDYTPGADVAAGDVVLLGNLAGWTNGIAHVPIANAAVGALAAGGGVYECINLDNAADGDKVYWDGDKVTTTSTNMSTFGFVVSRGEGGANSVCDVLHKPYV
jgi:predicted RecA/RadA family phage recombinase